MFVDKTGYARCYTRKLPAQVFRYDSANDILESITYHIVGIFQYRSHSNGTNKGNVRGEIFESVGMYFVACFFMATGNAHQLGTITNLV